MAFAGRNFLAWLLAQVITGLMFAAIFTDWYSWTSNYTEISTNTGGTVGASSATQLNYSNVFYNGTGWRIVSRASPTIVSGVSTNSPIVTTVYTYGGDNAQYSKVVQYFRLAFAFSIVAVILAILLGINLLLIFFSSVRNFYIDSCGMSTLRWLLGVLALGILVSNVIALLGFLGVTQGFKDDNASCSDGPCRIFSGSSKAEYGATIAQYTNWGPDAGWYVTIASIVLSIALCISIATLRFPIPYDTDDSSGEAL